MNFHHQDDHELRWLWIFSHERRWRTVMLVWWPFLLLYLCRRTFCFIVIYLRLFDCFTHKKRCLICDSKNNCFLTKSKVTLIPFSAIIVFFLSDNFQNSWMISRIISSVAVMLDRIAAGLSYRPSSWIIRWCCFRWGTQMRKNRTVLWTIRLPVEWL